MVENDGKKKKFTRIILAYPFVLAIVGLIANFLIFGISPAVISLPVQSVFVALALCAVFLLLNHALLMTSTELTRLKYNMHATPEEWEASEHEKADVPQQGMQELERRHNAHRNTTENVVYFILLAILTSLVTPVEMAAQFGFVGFTVGRLGHTMSYLSGRDGLRGLFMSLSLVSLFGLASYLLVSLTL